MSHGCILRPPQAKGQTADFGDVQRELSSRWKELSSEDPDRAKFERLAAEDRARFVRESAAKDLEVLRDQFVGGGGESAAEIILRCLFVAAHE